MFDPRRSPPMAEVMTAEMEFLLDSVNFPDSGLLPGTLSQLVSDPP